MKKIFLLITIAIGFAMAQTTTPTYDDDGRCNKPGSISVAGIPSDACQQDGYVCRLASEPSGSVFFWLGKNPDCTRLYTTQIETFLQNSTNPNELDLDQQNHKLRLTLSPKTYNSNAFGTAIVASQILSAKLDKAKVSVIYKFVPSQEGIADLNSIHLLSFGRAD
ncbi:MAG: hypothetical protein IJ905_06565 [Fibrobacter sp.]|nr:hypothetical protein [Fibrobacter sp.]